MSKAIPTVEQFMSDSPYVITADEPLAEAHALMKEHHIRHLPVLAGPQPVGVVSDGDLYHAEAMTGVDARKTCVRDVMTPRPYVVGPSTPLDEVVQEMAGRKLGSALVMENGRLVGIFTANDALGAFSALLQSRLR